jgi:ribosomal protein L30E
MVTKSGSVTLGKNRDIKLTYDQSSKAHLTSVKGAPNKADYTPVARVYHGKRLSVDPAHIDIDEGIHKVMKTTTYSIGKKGEDAPNEINTTNQTHLTQKVHKGEDPPKVDKNSRRCDPENPNRAKAVGFGFGSEKGTYEHQVVHRSKTFYGDVYNQQKVPHM